MPEEHHEPKTYAQFIEHAKHMHHETDLGELVREMFGTAKKFEESESVKTDLANSYDQLALGTSSDDLRKFLTDNMNPISVHGPAEIEATIDDRIFGMAGLLTKGLKVAGSDDKPDQYLFGNLTEMNKNNALQYIQNYLGVLDQVQQQEQGTAWKQIREHALHGRMGEAYQLLNNALRISHISTQRDAFWKVLVPQYAAPDLYGKIGDHLKELYKDQFDVLAPRVARYSESRDALQRYARNDSKGIKEKYGATPPAPVGGEHH